MIAACDVLVPFRPFDGLVSNPRRLPLPTNPDDLRLGRRGKARPPPGMWGAGSQPWGQSSPRALARWTAARRVSTPSLWYSDRAGGLHGVDRDAEVVGDLPGLEHGRQEPQQRQLAFGGVVQARSAGLRGHVRQGSTDTRASANTVRTSTTLRFIGICADDVAGTVVSNNHISGYNIALCVQTPGEAVLNNDVSASCTGVFVDPGIDGAKILDNHIKETNPSCRDENAPIFFVLGIVLSGAVNTEVRRNRVEGQTAGGLPNGFAAGLIVVDDSTTGAAPSGNVVTQNTLSNNDLDLFVRNTGTGNVIKHNKCTTSDPAGLCG